MCILSRRMGFGCYSNWRWKDNYGWRGARSPCTVTILLLLILPRNPQCRVTTGAIAGASRDNRPAKNHRTIRISRGFISITRLSNVYSLLRSLLHQDWHPPYHCRARKFRHQNEHNVQGNMYHGIIPHCFLLRSLPRWRRTNDIRLGHVLLSGG